MKATDVGQDHVPQWCSAVLAERPCGRGAQWGWEGTVQRSVGGCWTNPRTGVEHVRLPAWPAGRREGMHWPGGWALQVRPSVRWVRSSELAVLRRMRWDLERWPPRTTVQAEVLLAHHLRWARLQELRMVSVRFEVHLRLCGPRYPSPAVLEQVSECLTGGPNGVRVMDGGGVRSRWQVLAHLVTPAEWLDLVGAWQLVR